MQIEEYSTRVERVGVIGNSNYQYVVEMVIKPQWTKHRTAHFKGAIIAWQKKQ